MAISKESFEKLKVYLVAKGFIDKVDADVKEWTGKLKYAYHWAAHEFNRLLPHPQLAASQNHPEPNHESGIPEGLRAAAGIVLPEVDHAVEHAKDEVVKKAEEVVPALNEVKEEVNKGANHATAEIEKKAAEVAPEIEKGVEHAEGELEKKAEELTGGTPPPEGEGNAETPASNSKGE